MKINKITYTPAYKNIYAPKNSQPAFSGRTKAVKTLINCGILSVPVIIGLWLAKLFMHQPDDEIFLNDGSYFAHVDELV